MNGWFVRAVLVHFAALVPVHAMRPMVSYRALELGGTALDLGIIAASYALLAFFMAVPLGRWVDRIGEPALIVAGTVALSLAAASLTVAGSIPAIAATQALMGLALVTSNIGLQTLMANGGEPAQRDARIGTLSVVGSVGQMIGPAAGGLMFTVFSGSLRLIFGVCAVTGLIAVGIAVSLLLRPPARVEQDDRAVVPEESLLRSVATVMRRPSVPYAMLASMTVLTTIDLLTAYLPAYGEARGIPVATIGLLLSARAGASVMSRLVMLPLLRWQGRRRVMIASLALPAVAVAALPATSSTAVLFGCVIAAGLGLGLGQPLSLSWIADQVPPSMRGTAIGVRITGNRFGQLSIPLIIGAVAGAAGGVTTIFVATAVMLGGSAVSVLRSSEHPAPS